MREIGREEGREGYAESSPVVPIHPPVHPSPAIVVAVLGGFVDDHVGPSVRDKLRCTILREKDRAALDLTGYLTGHVTEGCARECFVQHLTG